MTFSCQLSTARWPPTPPTIVSMSVYIKSRSSVLTQTNSGVVENRINIGYSLRKLARPSLILRSIEVSGCLDPVQLLPLSRDFELCNLGHHPVKVKWIGLWYKAGSPFPMTEGPILLVPYIGTTSAKNYTYILLVMFSARCAATVVILKHFNVPVITRIRTFKPE